MPYKDDLGLTSEQSIKIVACKGLNTAFPPDRIDDLEARALSNFELNLSGELTKRKPIFATAGTPGSSAFYWGIFILSLATQTLSSSSASLKSYTGSVWNTVATTGSNITWIVQYIDIAYILTASSGVYRWDGTTLTAIAGSPSGTFMGVFKDRLFVVNGSGPFIINSRLYYSDIGNGSSWTSTNFIDVISDSYDVLQSVYPMQDKLLIFKNNRIYSLYIQGSPLNWILRLTRSNLGSLYPKTFSEYKGNLYFLGTDGVYITDGAEFTLISDKVKDKIYTLQNPAAGFFKDRYLLSTIAGGGILVYYPKIGGWSSWKFKNDSTKLYHSYNVISLGVVNPSILFIEELTTDHTTRLMYISTDESNSTLLLDETVDEYAVLYTSKTFEFMSETKFKRGKLLTFFADIQFASDLDTLLVLYGTEKTPAGSLYSEIITFEDVETGKFPYKVRGPGFFRQLNITFTATKARKFDFFGFELKMSPKRDFIKSGSGS